MSNALNTPKRNASGINGGWKRADELNLGDQIMLDTWGQGSGRGGTYDAIAPEVGSAVVITLRDGTDYRGTVRAHHTSGVELRQGKRTRIIPAPWIAGWVFDWRASDKKV